MKIVSLNETICSVRILFTNVTLPYMSHIIGVKGEKADRQSSVRWNYTPCVDFTDGVILASYRCNEEDNF